MRKHTKDKSQAKLTSFTVSKPEGPSTSTSEPRPLGLFTVGDATLEAEIFWSVKVASCNYSLWSTDHIGDLFRKMFPDSKIAENFKLSHTSASYIIGHGLLPHFTKVLISDLSDSQLPFSVHFDETTSSQVKKQMDLTLHYGPQCIEKYGLVSILHSSLVMLKVKLWQQQYTRKC